MADCRASARRLPDGAVDISLSRRLDVATVRGWRRPGGRVYISWSGFTHEPPVLAEGLEIRFRRVAGQIADALLDREAA